jgi:hypothetical protein
MLRKSVIALGLVGLLGTLAMAPTGASACPAGDAHAALMRLDAALTSTAPNEPAGAKGLRDQAQRQLFDRDYQAASRTIDRAMQMLGIKITADNAASAAPHDHSAPLSRC